MELDKKDKVILLELQHNCKQSVRILGKKLGVPATTVHQRIKKLESAGVIKGYHAVIDAEKIGLASTAIILIEIVHEPSTKGTKTAVSDILDALAKIPNVVEVFAMTGSYDMMIKVRGKNERELGKFVMTHLRNLKGIGRTYTAMVIHTGKETLKVDV